MEELKKELKKRFYFIFTLTLIIDVLILLISSINLIMMWYPTLPRILIGDAIFIINVLSLIILSIFIKNEYKIGKVLWWLGSFTFPIMSLILIWIILIRVDGPFLIDMIRGSVSIVDPMELFIFFGSLLTLVLFILTSFYWTRYRKLFEVKV